MTDSPKGLSGLEQARQRAQDGQVAQDKRPSKESEIELGPYVLICSQGQWYAVDALQVQRVVAKGPITRVPGRSAHILGVTLVNDALIPVVDLAVLSGASGTSSQTEIAPRLIILCHDDNCVGVIAEEAHGIEDLPRKLEGSRRGVIAGEKFWNDRQIAYIDVNKLISAGNDHQGAREAL